jgi:hypothetical protein
VVFNGPNLKNISMITMSFILKALLLFLEYFGAPSITKSGLEKLFTIKQDGYRAIVDD